MLDDIYNTYYDGILDDGYDLVSYDEWSDCMSDVYDFRSDVSSALWDNDVEKAKEEIADFKDDIEALKAE